MLEKQRQQHDNRNMTFCHSIRGAVCKGILKRPHSFKNWGAEHAARSHVCKCYIYVYYKKCITIYDARYTVIFTRAAQEPAQNNPYSKIYT